MVVEGARGSLEVEDVDVILVVERAVVLGMDAEAGVGADADERAK